jgi:hypothetical protein
VLRALVQVPSIPRCHRVICRYLGRDGLLSSGAMLANGSAMILRPRFRATPSLDGFSAVVAVGTHLPTQLQATGSKKAATSTVSFGWLTQPILQFVMLLGAPTTSRTVWRYRRRSIGPSITA